MNNPRDKQIKYCDRVTSEMCDALKLYGLERCVVHAALMMAYSSGGVAVLGDLKEIENEL